MPLQLPDLDNRSYDSLLQEMTAAIPKYTKEWTNLNPSEPGMMLLELLVWVVKTLEYRANLVPAEADLNFLNLVSGTRDVWQNDIEDDPDHLALFEYIGKVQNGIGQGTNPGLPDMQDQVLKFLNSKFHMVTEEDFKEVICGHFFDIKRVEVLTQAKDEIDIIIIPDSKVSLSDVTDYIRPRLLLGTIFEVKPAQYQDLYLQLKVSYEDYVLADKQAVNDELAGKISGYLDSISGGPDNTGWPYGRTLRVYDLFYVADQVKDVNIIGINYKTKLDDDWGTLTSLPVAGLINLKCNNDQIIDIIEDNPSSGTTTSR
jgi:hypothetical protein